jgi:hypothetical protein
MWHSLLLLNPKSRRMNLSCRLGRKKHQRLVNNHHNQIRWLLNHLLFNNLHLHHNPPPHRLPRIHHPLLLIATFIIINNNNNNHQTTKHHRQSKKIKILADGQPRNTVSSSMVLNNMARDGRKLPR